MRHVMNISILRGAKLPKENANGPLERFISIYAHSKKDNCNGIQ